MTEYRDMAFHDIETDSVKTFGFGLPLPPKDSLQLLRNNKRLTIYKKYGLYVKNLGCIIGDKELDEATDEYKKITNPYLEKRNGKGWREKLKKEIKSIN